MDAPSTQKQHPEMLEGEVFLCDIEQTNRDVVLFITISWLYYRISSTAHDSLGKIIPGRCSVFVWKKESEALVNGQLMTAKEWCLELELSLMDKSGWRYPNGDHDFHNTPVSFSEFRKKFRQCTGVDRRMLKINPADK